jgi:hypothetical protein
VKLTVSNPINYSKQLIRINAEFFQSVLFRRAVLLLKLAKGRSIIKINKMIFFVQNYSKKSIRTEKMFTLSSLRSRPVKRFVYDLFIL